MRDYQIYFVCNFFYLLNFQSVVDRFARKSCTRGKSLFDRNRVPRFVNIEAVARRKLEQLNQAELLEDLRVPPGNHLEALKRDRFGQHSIRVNEQFRVCFRWTEGGPEDVEIVDYH